MDAMKTMNRRDEVRITPWRTNGGLQGVVAWSLGVAWRRLGVLLDGETVGCDS